MLSSPSTIALARASGLMETPFLVEPHRAGTVAGSGEQPAQAVGVGGFLGRGRPHIGRATARAARDGTRPAMAGRDRAAAPQCVADPRLDFLEPPAHRRTPLPVLTLDAAKDDEAACQRGGDRAED